MTDKLTPAEERVMKKVLSRAGKNNVAKNGVGHMKTIGAKGGAAGKGKNKKRINKSTETFREMFIERNILKALNWKGAHMVFPYTWNGTQRYAVIPTARLIKSISWDKKKG